MSNWHNSISIWEVKLIIVLPSTSFGGHSPRTTKARRAHLRDKHTILFGGANVPQVVRFGAPVFGKVEHFWAITSGVELSLGSLAWQSDVDSYVFLARRTSTWKPWDTTRAESLLSSFLDEPGRSCAVHPELPVSTLSSQGESLAQVHGTRFTRSAEWKQIILALRTKLTSKRSGKIA